MEDQAKINEQLQSELTRLRRERSWEKRPKAFALKYC